MSHNARETVLPGLSRIDYLALDTETTGLSRYDRPVGVSWSLPDGRNGYARWGHEGGENNCTVDDVRRWLNCEVDQRSKTVYVHNAGFDLRQLAYVGHSRKGTPGTGVRLKHCRIEDTGFMAALLNELEPDFSLDGLGQRYCGLRKRGDILWDYLAQKHGGTATRRQQGKRIWRAPGDVVDEYARFDAHNTRRLAETLRPRLSDENLETVYALETDLIPLLLDMHLIGVRVDRHAAETLRDHLEQKLKRLQERWDSEVGNVNWASTRQLVPLFERNGIPYAVTEKGNASINIDVLNASDHPLCDMIKQLKKLRHYSGTFIKNYLLEVVDDNDLIHPEFYPLRNSFYGTVSGRFSSGGELNLQNIPARDPDWAPLIRSLFVPYHEDSHWFKVDYSQIEFRFFSHYAGGEVLKAYRNDPRVDFHSWVATLTNLPRKAAKNVNFGLLYGAGVKKMAQMLQLSQADATALLATYHRKFPDARRLSRKAERRAARRGYIITWGGRRRRFKQSGNRYLKTHMSLNALLQGSAADLMKHAMVRIAPLLDWRRTPLHSTIHDELNFTIPRGEEGRRFVRDVKELMEDFSLRAPIIADCELGDNWGHTESTQAEYRK